MGKKSKTKTHTKVEPSDQVTNETDAEPKESKEAQNLQVPDLDQLITQITNNGDFKEMMSNISGGLSQDHQKILEATDVDVDADADTDEENTSNISMTDERDGHQDINSDPHYDMMCSLFTDNDGNNVCELLGSINQNLTELNQNFQSLINSQHSDSSEQSDQST